MIYRCHHAQARRGQVRMPGSLLESTGGSILPSDEVAAGREVSRALGPLSDGAFKLYIHLCLNADRSTGLLSADHGDLVKALGKRDRKSTRLNSSHLGIS